MRILVIGSKGFIGSHCVDYFKPNNEVWECDVIADYNNKNYIWIDSVDSDFLEIFQNHEFDVCINCSGAANVPFSLEKPYNDFRLNTLNVFKLLEAIRLHNINCKFITMSSAAVYGNPEALPITPSQRVAPVSPYGYHKVFAESICEEYSRFWGVKTCCVRIFSAYGPRLKKQLFWDMYNKFCENEVIELWGTGKESRDFIYISDLIRAVDMVIRNCDFTGNKVNLANGSQITIREVADTFVKVLNTDKEIRFNGAERKGDPINWEADISDLKKWGYQQQVSLEEGIQEYIEWVKNNQGLKE
jgi:dTDP-glucose 4,6-dehydratase/UDP-glucose 4-epimerase